MAAQLAPNLREAYFSRLALRNLTFDELTQAAHIEQQVYEFPWSLGNFRDSLAAGYTCSGVFEGHELLAYAILMFAPDEAHLLNIAVARAAQGRGIGRRLMQSVVNEARRHGSQMLYLEVRPTNTVARLLYTSMGFRQIAIRPGYYPAHGKREDALFLGLLL
jgi:ribosomal-protein-alanine N-acetyltransferase